MASEKGRVILVGAGCGSADLITLRGMQRLQHCDAVVYDDLIDEALLDFTPERCERHYVGKRSGRHSMRQEEINALLIRLAGSGKTVVRLKGGDPFVFGRGGEEILALDAAGIPCEEVPGITSAIAIAAAAGIPVTHRNMSRSLHIISGHTSTGETAEEYRALAALEGTLVFLMGLSHVQQIADGLLSGGKAPDTPAAILSGGNSAHPCTVRTTLAALSDAAREAQVQSPAILLIGKVAALSLPL